MQAVGFDNGGKELGTASNQSFITIRRWDVVNKKLISEIKLQADKYGRAVRDGTLMFSGDRRRVVAATDLKAIDLSTDGKRLVTTNGSGANIWETRTGQLLRSIPNDNTGNPHVLANVATRVIRITRNHCAHSRYQPERASVRFKWSPALPNRTLARSGSLAGRAVISCDPYHVWSMQFSPDGQQLAMGDILGVKFKRTHSATINVAGPEDGEKPTSVPITSGQIEFEYGSQELPALRSEPNALASGEKTKARG